jgi:hypothetical protein
MRIRFLGTIFLFFTLCQANFLLAARNICLVPCDRWAFTSNWRYSSSIPSDQLSFYQRLDKVIQEHNGTFLMSDLSEFLQPGGMQKFDQIDTFIFLNSPDWVGFDWRKCLFEGRKKKVIAILFEPPTVMPELYTSAFSSYCDEVLTWDDSLVDNKKFFKYHYAVLQDMIKNKIPFQRKKMFTMMCGNKTSLHPKELYSERLKVIHYFEKQKNNDFEFYGPGWDQLGFRSYRGIASDKLSTLNRYRFNICYENMKGVQGYITEKIFDSFAAGCVPVYWGASNVTDYIPRNCFIRRKDFSSFDALVKHLRNMQEPEYNRYIENIQRFLKSKEAQKFSRDNLYLALVERLKLT